MSDRHPAAVLLGAALGLTLAEVATAGALLAAWALVREPWWSVELLGCAAAFGLGLGLVVGAAEVVARGRGLIAGALVLALAWPLPALAGAFARLRLSSTRPRGELEAIDHLARVVTDRAAWGSGLALVTIVLAVYAPLLRARLRGEDAPEQAGAMAWGALTWLALALTFASSWPGEEVELWVCLLLLAGRGAFTAPALAASDRLAGLALDRVRGLTARPTQPTSRTRWAGMLLGGALALPVAALPGVIAPGEGASLGVARLRALFGRDARHALAARLVRFDWSPGGSRTRLLGPLDVVAVASRMPDVDWDARARESSSLLQDLARDGHPRSIATLAERRELRGPLTADALIAGVRPAADEGDPVGMRALGRLLLERAEWREAARWLERAADAGDALALVTLATRLRAAHDPETSALLRRALGMSEDPLVRACAAAELEWLYERYPAHRSSLDRPRDVLFLDPSGRPLDGAVILELMQPSGALGWSSRWSRYVRRALVRGRIPEGLVDGTRIEAAWYSWDLERATAGVDDGFSFVYEVDVREVVEVKLNRSAYAPLTGRVLDRAGAPAPDVAVVLRKATPLDPSARGRVELKGIVVFTAVDGRFESPLLPPGEYQVALLDDEGLVEVAELATVKVPTAAPVELRVRPSLRVR